MLCSNYIAIIICASICSPGACAMDLNPAASHALSSGRSSPSCPMHRVIPNSWAPLPSPKTKPSPNAAWHSTSHAFTSDECIPALNERYHVVIINKQTRPVLWLPTPLIARLSLQQLRSSQLKGHAPRLGGNLGRGKKNQDLQPLNRKME